MSVCLPGSIGGIDELAASCVLAEDELVAVPGRVLTAPLPPWLRNCLHDDDMARVGQRLCKPRTPLTNDRKIRAMSTNRNKRAVQHDVQ